MTTIVDRLVELARVADAAGSTTYLSGGESVAAALVLNRADWLAEMNYTFGEAIGRLDSDWLAKIPEAARKYRDGKNAAGRLMVHARAAATVSSLAEQSKSTERIDLIATLVTYGHAPGYRDMDLHVDMRRLGRDDEPPIHAIVRFNAADTLQVAEHAMYVLRSAWTARSGRAVPIDHKDGETVPRWVELIAKTTLRD